MAKPPPTRNALLARKQQIELASRGRELLDKKRSVLTHEILKIAETVMEDAGRLRIAAAEARRALAHAQRTAGPAAVRSAALAAGDNLPIQVSARNVMGVRIPTIESRRKARTLIERDYAFVGTSITIEETAEAFEAEVDALVDLAESRLRLRRLTEEVRRTSRRLNALEHLLIPRLVREREEIERVLEDREREDRYRLKRAKQKLEK